MQLAPGSNCNYQVAHGPTSSGFSTWHSDTVLKWEGRGKLLVFVFNRLGKLQDYSRASIRRKPCEMKILY
jgi:hypothetical protein